MNAEEKLKAREAAYAEYQQATRAARRAADAARKKYWEKLAAIESGENPESQPKKEE